jgi:hypothetical protein
MTSFIEVWLGVWFGTKSLQVSLAKFMELKWGGGHSLHFQFFLDYILRE